jgi:hypothetical protein
MKAWPVTKTLRLCHAYGERKLSMRQIDEHHQLTLVTLIGDSAVIHKLPQELVDQIEEHLMLLEKAPESQEKFKAWYAENKGGCWRPVPWEDL